MDQLGGLTIKPLILFLLLSACTQLKQKMADPLAKTPGQKDAANKTAETTAKTQATPKETQPKSIDVTPTPEIQHWISYFTGKGKKSFVRWVDKAESLKPQLSPILAKKDLPFEVLYLAMVESGFNTQASYQKSKGPWQFLAGTARLYGLQVSKRVDERRDPEKSTAAAASYLRELYDRFGDWPLVMASFNTGPARVEAAIKRGKSNDYRYLCKKRYLGVQACKFVPKVLAAFVVGSNPQAFGLNGGDDRGYVREHGREPRADQKQYAGAIRLRRPES